MNNNKITQIKENVLLANEALSTIGQCLDTIIQRYDTGQNLAEELRQICFRGVDVAAAHINEINTLLSTDNIKDKKEDLAQLDTIAKPVMEWLKNKYHPHCQLIITQNSAKLTEDLLCCNLIYQNKNIE